jgi:hypothetical protein
MEQKLNWVSKTVNGKEYNNLNLKSKPLKGIVGLDSGNFVIFTKKYAEGRSIVSQYGESFSCMVEYAGKEGTFFLKPREHKDYAACGGVGDKVKISLNKEPWTNPKTGVEMILSNLSFEKV